MKNEDLKKYFSKKTNLEFNSEQMNAIKEIDNHLLLKARAGSGKTRVITAKAFFLMNHEKINPNEVMLLAFNKSAAEEMKKRLEEKYKLKGFTNARTFHSLAHRLAYKNGAQLMFDENHSNVSTKKQSKFIQKLVEEFANPVFKSKLYELFRREAEELEKLGTYLSDPEYLVYRRGLTNITLKGDRVKSKGEKWIGDFLFEHDITHFYEKGWKVADGGWSYKQNKGIYNPDFSLMFAAENQNIVIEHWGIDENEVNGSVPKHWTVSWDEYRDEMDRKRQYWKTYNLNKPLEPVTFIETSIADMTDRNNFEAILKGRLNEHGIEVNKLSDDKLFSKLETFQIARITDMFKSFIGNTTKRMWTPDELEKKIKKVNSNNHQVSGFYELGSIIYRRYVETLKRENKLDFDGLIESAIRKIHDTKGDCQLDIDENRSITINKLKYLMVDEYQDFSPLFHEMIKAILKYNKTMKVFCVGDDWQAINSFAGSDLQYFNKFKSFFDSSKEMNLLDNYRSTKNIVQLSNSLMINKGEESKANSKDNKFIGKCHTNEMFIDQNKDQKFIPESKNNFVDYQLAVQLKFCHSILTHSNNLVPEKKITTLIINRTNQITSSCDKDKFHANLKIICSDKIDKDYFDDNIKVVTAHSSKGQEADIVIILNANNKKYPLIHPDIAFKFIFDKDCIQNLLNEERRLFYVAMTRAKKQLYFVSDEESESDYVKEITEDWLRVKANDCFIHFVPKEVIKS
jgi:DNA helicase IV